LDINFTVGTSCERAAPLAEKNAAAQPHVLRSLISLHNEHRVLINVSKDLGLGWRVKWWTFLGTVIDLNSP
jgi:hypothetical protein